MRFFALSLMLLAPVDIVADEPKKSDPFEETARGLVLGTYPYQSEFAMVPSLGVWNCVESPEIAQFLKQLPIALRESDSKRQETAVRFIQVYATLARRNAYECGNNMELAAQRAFAPMFRSIQSSLLRLLKSPNSKTRCYAAGALLAFNPNNAAANSVFAKAIRSNDVKLCETVCQMIGTMKLSNRAAVDTLIFALQRQEMGLRRSAAIAVSEIGTPAKSAAPALIKLLKTGRNAECRTGPFFQIAVPQRRNTAIMGLQELGPDAKAAVPVLMQMLSSVNNERKREMLVCLAKIGPSARASIPLVRTLMNNEKLKYVAGPALLGIDPQNKAALVLLNKVLAEQDKKTCKEVLTAFDDIGSKSAIFLPSLVKILANENETVRILATRFLGRMGAKAEAAIPVLEKLLTKPQESGHTFFSHGAAALALADIGGQSMPALIRVIRNPNSGGHQYAMYYALPGMGKDAKPAVKHLIDIVRDEKDPFRIFAAIALGHLGTYARDARPAISQLKKALHTKRDHENKEELLWIEWALSEIPE